MRYLHLGSVEKGKPGTIYLTRWEMRSASNRVARGGQRQKPVHTCPTGRNRRSMHTAQLTCSGWREDSSDAIRDGPLTPTRRWHYGERAHVWSRCAAIGLVSSMHMTCIDFSELYHVLMTIYTGNRFQSMPVDYLS